MQTSAGSPFPQNVIMPALAQEVAIVAIGIVIAAMLVHAFYVLRRHGDDRFLILLASGATASLLEGFACHLIKCYHPPVAMIEVYEAFGIHVPLWLAMLYVPFYGGLTYYLLRGFSKSTLLTKSFWSFFVIVAIAEGVGEMIGIHFGMFYYHGAQPLPIFGFPLYLGFINSTLALVLSMVSVLWFRHVAGAARYLLVFLTPALLTGIYAVLIFPTAAFLYADNHGMAVIGSIVSMVLAVAAAGLAYRVLADLWRRDALGF